MNGAVLYIMVKMREPGYGRMRLGSRIFLIFFKNYIIIIIGNKKGGVFMGVDIKMFIIDSNKEVLKEDIFDGRDSEWFSNLQDNGYNEVYNFCPIVFGWDSVCTESFIKQYAIPQDYYGHFHISVKLFKDWFKKYNPHKRAGWVTTYEKWKMENQHWKPSDSEVQLKLHSDNVLADMHFVEWIDECDSSGWLYDYLINNNIPDNAWIVYCFTG